MPSLLLYPLGPVALEPNGVQSYTLARVDWDRAPINWHSSLVTTATAVFATFSLIYYTGTYTRTVYYRCPSPGSFLQHGDQRVYPRLCARDVPRLTAARNERYSF